MPVAALNLNLVAKVRTNGELADAVVLFYVNDLNTPLMANKESTGVYYLTRPMQSLPPADALALIDDVAEVADKEIAITSLLLERIGSGRLALEAPKLLRCLKLFGLTTLAIDLGLSVFKKVKEIAELGDVGVRIYPPAGALGGAVFKQGQYDLHSASSLQKVWEVGFSAPVPDLSIKIRTDPVGVPNTYSNLWEFKFIVEYKNAKSNSYILVSGQSVRTPKPEFPDLDPIVEDEVFGDANISGSGYVYWDAVVHTQHYFNCVTTVDVRINGDRKAKVTFKVQGGTDENAEMDIDYD
jgi:hypothetical protein